MSIKREQCFMKELQIRSIVVKKFSFSSEIIFFRMISFFNFSIFLYSFTGIVSVSEFFKNKCGKNIHSFVMSR